MLNDAPPIPQYIIRTLLDCLYVRQDVADSVSTQLSRSVRALPALVRRWGGARIGWIAYLLPNRGGYVLFFAICMCFLLC